MLLATLTVITASLTVAMFATRQMLLGFPSLMFWAILGGYCYTQSVYDWDIYYITFFAAEGMAVFCTVAMFALRRRDIEPKPQDWDEPGLEAGRGEIETGIEEPTFKDETGDTPSSRQRAVRDRANQRRTSGVRGKTDWKEFG